MPAWTAGVRSEGLEQQRAAKEIAQQAHRFVKDLVRPC